MAPSTSNDPSSYLSFRLLSAIVWVGPALFTLVWVTGQWWHPSYNPQTDSISYLAVGTNSWVQTTSFIILAIFSAMLTMAVRSTVGSSIRSWVGLSLLITFSAGVLGAGVFNVDSSWLPHQIFSVFAFISIIGAMLVFWSVFRQSQKWQALASFSLGTGLIAAGLLLLVIMMSSDINGLIQRLFILSWTLWLQVVSLRLLLHFR